MAEDIKVDMYTMCLVQDGNKVLLINRPRRIRRSWLIGPGGKIDFPKA